MIPPRAVTPAETAPPPAGAGEIAGRRLCPRPELGHGLINAPGFVDNNARRANKDPHYILITFRRERSTSFLVATGALLRNGQRRVQTHCRGGETVGRFEYKCEARYSFYTYTYVYNIY